jgi:hypothetical protein
LFYTTKVQLSKLVVSDELDVPFLDYQAGLSLNLGSQWYTRTNQMQPNGRDVSSSRARLEKP